MTIDENGRSTLDYKVMKTKYGNADAMRISVERLHERLGHAGQNAIDRIMKEQLVNGINGIKRGSVEICNICKLGKLPRKSFAKVTRDPSICHPVDMIFVDLAGPNKPAILGGAYYDTVIIDAYTRRTWVLLLKKKSDATEKLETWGTADGKVDRYKARLVAKGSTQREGLKYTETFAPTLHFESLRTLIAYAASENICMEHMDVSTTFLYAEIDEEVFMEIP